MKLKYGELFSGPGGLALGAVGSKIKHSGRPHEIIHAWASDIDDDSCETYRANVAKGDPESVICADVKGLDLSKLGPVDIFAYGFPCNDFSVVGERRGFSGRFGPLYSYGVKILNLYRPKIFVAENVGGITSANEGKAFEKIVRDLSESGNGYTITAHKYRAEDYGVPQTRHRVIMVGVDKKLNKQFQVPAPTHAERHVTVREAFENPPISQSAYNHELKRQSAIVIERLEKIAPGENVWNANLPERLKLNVKSARLSQIYKRLHPDRPSYTMTGSGGGGTHGYHYAEPRALTNRERARIQTFPDDFKFVGSIESVRRQIGMAVPPVLSRAVFTALLKMIAGVDYASVPSNIKFNNQMHLL